MLARWLARPARGLALVFSLGAIVSPRSAANPVAVAAEVCYSALFGVARLDPVHEHAALRSELAAYVLPQSIAELDSQLAAGNIGARGIHRGAVHERLRTLDNTPEARARQREELLTLRRRMEARARNGATSLSRDEFLRWAALEMSEGTLEERRARLIEAQREVMMGGSSPEAVNTLLNLMVSFPSPPTELIHTLDAVVMTGHPGQWEKAALALMEHGEVPGCSLAAPKEFERWLEKQGGELTEESGGVLREMISRWPDQNFEIWMWLMPPRILERIDPHATLLRNRPSRVLLNLVASGPEYLRVRVAKSLINRFDHETLPIISKMVDRELGERESREVMLQLIEALRGRNHLDAIGQLVRIKEGSRYPDVRRRAWLVAGELGQQQGGFSSETITSRTRRLAQAFGNDMPERRQRDAVSELREMPTVTASEDGSVPLFRTALRSRFATVRLDAMDALVGRQDRATLELALEVARNPREPSEMRIRALEVLRRIPGRESDSAIREAWHDSNERVRRHALLMEPLERSISPERLGGSIPVALRRQLSQLARYDVASLGKRDTYLHQAASLVYLAPDASMGHTAQQMVQRMDDLQRLIPEHQRLMWVGSDPRTSFKFFVSATLEGAPVRRLTVAIAGSEGVVDWLTNMNYGAPQVQSDAYRALREQLRAYLAQGWDIDITGHSLGGAASQALAYDLETARAQMQGAGAVRVVTWNGLGGVEALRRVGNYDEEKARRVDAINYHVPGDVVFYIGARLGTDRELPPMASGPTALTPLLRRAQTIYRNHIMDAVSRNVDLQNGLAEAAIRPLPVAPVLPFLSRAMGWLPRWIQERLYARRRLNYLHTLHEASILWASRMGYRDLRPEFTPFQFEIDQLTRELTDSGIDVRRLTQRVREARDLVIEAKQRAGRSGTGNR